MTFAAFAVAIFAFAVTATLSVHAVAAFVTVLAALVTLAVFTWVYVAAADSKTHSEAEHQSIDDSHRNLLLVIICMSERGRYVKAQKIDR